MCQTFRNPAAILTREEASPLSLTLGVHCRNLSWIQRVCYNAFRTDNRSQCLCKQRMLIIHDGGWSWELAWLGIMTSLLEIFRMYSISLVSRNVELSEFARNLFAFDVLALGRNNFYTRVKLLSRSYTSTLKFSLLHAITHWSPQLSLLVSSLH